MYYARLATDRIQIAARPTNIHIIVEYVERDPIQIRRVTVAEVFS